MEFRQLTDRTASNFARARCNYVSSEDALIPELAGMKIYDEPIFGVASADSEDFKTLLLPEVVGSEVLMPKDILPDAKSVISVFAPFTEAVRRSNAMKREGASLQWKHGRIEGQLAIMDLAEKMCELLRAEGYEAMIPVLSDQFATVTPIKSNWSERHVAWVCGLGTFGISRGLITEKGMAGRFASLVTNAVFPQTPHKYSWAFDYCIMCGACAGHCPVNAIDPARGVIHGKNQQICAPYVLSTLGEPSGIHRRFYYGCGKCQVNVPCEKGIPLKAGK